MILRRLRFVAVLMVLSACFLGGGAARPAGTAAAPPAQANWVFEGCWTQWPSGPCRDVYRDSQGNYWICRDCGTTGSPSTSKCTRIGSSTLGTGYWCS
jgi:ribosomal protein L40E